MEENQNHRVRLFRGIIKPKAEFAGLMEADQIRGLAWRIIVLSVVNAIIVSLINLYASQYLNLPQAHNPMLSEKVVKALAIGGAAFGGLISPILTMLIMALIFLIFFREIGYKKLFAVELYLQLIGLIGTILSGVLMLIFHLPEKSYLNLGAITSIFTNQLWINTFFGGISIFLIWKVYVQCQAYRAASAKSASRVDWTLIFINIAFLLILSGFAALGNFLTSHLQDFQNFTPPAK